MTKIIRVDLPDESPSDGIFQWGYSNENNRYEYVEYNPAIKNQVVVNDSVRHEVVIYIEDIPMLILALQAAHKHITNS